ncbi:MAG: LPS export ABC transporter ATP-binding protein [Chitinispirillia bacterium]|nr:LPS export ABC transporter ATP-binding protein [Chitinispirillia bacterium]MCL2241358.1 LPS export ABC transporter ATP-binding protein [Chitinispirillia bacterium]
MDNEENIPKNPENQAAAQAAPDAGSPPASAFAPAAPQTAPSRPVREIRTEGLVKIYNKRYVVNGTSITVKQGEIVGLLGPNGAGKTTSFYMIVGLIRANKGKIFLDNKNISRKPMYRRARMGIGYLPQEPSIFRKLSVADNIMAVLEYQRMSAKQRKIRMRELLEELNVGHLERSLGYMLSGGERRRVEIARTLAIKPDFILLDEPFAGVDPIAVEDIQSIVHQLKDKGYGVLITDHNVRETLRITDRAYIMCEGKILISGTAHELANSPEARKIYLGQNFTL